jgi:hypothetical protein
MHKFSDFGINPLEDRNIFNVPKISIEDLVNCEIEVLDFEGNVTTKHGEGRYIVKIRHNENEYKFWTTAAPIKAALDRIPKGGFPFITTIKLQRFGAGSGKTYYFT